MLRVFPIFSVVLCLLLSAVSSQACGGFFCRFSPMNQLSERILFVDHGDSVTTHVQIAYQGKASDFAWVLPVPSRPSLAVSHNHLFDALQFATQPTFVLEWEENLDLCGIFPPFLRFEDAVATVEDGGVQIVSQQRVGPYDSVVLTAEDPDAIVRWLTGNGYQLGALGPELLSPYVDGGMHFLALRLAPDRDIGDL